MAHHQRQVDAVLPNHHPAAPEAAAQGIPSAVQRARIRLADRAPQRVAGARREGPPPPSTVFQVRS